MYKIIDVLAYFHYLCFLRGKPNACFTGENLHEFFKSEEIDISKSDLSLILRNLEDSGLLKWTEQSPLVYVVNKEIERYLDKLALKNKEDVDQIRDISRRFYNFYGCDFEGKRFIDII